MSEKPKCFGDPHIIVETKCEECPLLVECVGRGFSIPDNRPEVEKLGRNMPSQYYDGSDSRDGMRP